MLHACFVSRRLEIHVASSSHWYLHTDDMPGTPWNLQRSTLDRYAQLASLGRLIFPWRSLVGCSKGWMGDLFELAATPSKRDSKNLKIT